MNEYEIILFYFIDMFNIYKWSVMHNNWLKRNIEARSTNLVLLFLGVKNWFWVLKNFFILKKYVFDQVFIFELKKYCKKLDPNTH